MPDNWFSASNTDRIVVIIVAAIAALIAIIGSALAWVTFTDPFGNQVSFAGTASTDGTGKATLILAVIALVVLGALCLKSLRKHIRPISSFVILLGTATTGIAIYKLVYYERKLSELWGDPTFDGIASVSIGLYRACLTKPLAQFRATRGRPILVSYGMTSLGIRQRIFSCQRKPTP